MDIQRWEYRIWPRTIPPALEPRLATTTMPPEPARTDTYLLTEDPDIMPKLRDDELLDIKRRRGRRDGLERWTALKKCAFPLGPGDLWPFPDRLARQSGWMRPDLLADAAREAGLLVASVRKSRRLFEIESTSLEITQVDGGGLPPLTLCAEGEDFEATRRVAELYGLTDLPNINYAAALREAVTS